LPKSTQSTIARLIREFKIRYGGQRQTRGRAEMDIKVAVAAMAVLGGLASLAYAQRPSAICPVHGVSGSPTGAPINDKGQCEYEHSMDSGNSIHRFRASCYY
jgi:hypothetical protein